MAALRRLSRGVVVPGLLSCLLLPAAPARADEARERALEARVKALELEVQHLAAQLEPGQATAVHRRKRSPIRSGTSTAMHSPPPTPDTAAATARELPAGSGAQTLAAPGQAAPTPASADAGATAPSLGAPKPNSAPQETFVFRENSVTLRPWHFEASTELGYVHGDGFLQTDRALTSTTALRLGILDWLELNATIPAFSSTRTRGTGPFRTESKEVGGLGDILLQANARVHEQTEDTPGLVLSLGALLPTGPAPYDFSHYQPNPAAIAYNPNPTDIHAAYFSRGTWGVAGNLQVYKTVDPVILFAGAGVRYLLPQSVQGHTVQAGVIYTYNLGFSLALSEKSTLGFQVAGSYQDKLVVDGHGVPQSNLEPVVARVSLIQRIFPQTWLEPALAAGLTSNAPGLELSLGLRHRF